MKNFIIILLFSLLPIFIFAQGTYTSSFTGSQIDSVLSNSLMTPQNILFVSSKSKYKTISSAISAWQAGDVIFLAPQTFNENVTLSDSGITVVGLNREQTSINNLTIRGKDVVVKNIHVKDTLKVLCSDSITFYTYNLLDNCIFSGDVFIGTSDSMNIYGTKINNSLFNGYNKNFIYNSQMIWDEDHWQGDLFLPNDTINTKTWDKAGWYDFYLYHGTIDLQYANMIEVDTIFYMPASSGYAQLSLINSRLICTTIINTDSLSSHIQVFAQQGGSFSADSVLKIQGKFEFDFYWCRIYMKNNIEYNSTVSSRFSNSQEFMYGSTAIIYGTHLSNLYIQHCIFHCSVPTGLGEDIGNSWNAFIDN